MSEGPVIGSGFVARGEDGVISGVGRWCGFPFVIQLELSERAGRKGYNLVLKAAPPPGEDPLVDNLLGLPMQITPPLGGK